MTTFLFYIILLEAGAPPLGFDTYLLDKGALGLFLLALIYVVRYLAKQWTTQLDKSAIEHDKVVIVYKEEIAKVAEQRTLVSQQKELLNEKFLTHLEDTESKLLEIIKENSKAFNVLSESNEGISSSIQLLVSSISDRNKTTQQFNENVDKLLNKIR